MSSLHKQLLSPLPNVLNGTMAMKKSQEIQNLCVAQHIVCTNIIIHTDQTATITVEGSGEVILSLKKDLAQQITSLQLTIRQLTINDKRFRRLDFRFDRPVLTYE